VSSRWLWGMGLVECGNSFQYQTFNHRATLLPTTPMNYPG
jgi:hypothetical protein